MNSSSYCRLRYENLVGDVESSLSMILDHLDLGHETNRSQFLNSNFDPKSAHTIAGNPMRFNHNPLTLKLDDEWKTAMNKRGKSLITAFTFPLMKHYGY